MEDGPLSLCYHMRQARHLGGILGLTVSIMQLPELNANIIIIAGLGLGAVYGVLAGKQRLRLLILSVYVGIVLAGQLTDALAPSLRMVTLEQVSWGLFAAPIAIFGFFGVVHAKHHAKGALIANLIVGLLTAALIISSVLELLPTSTVAAINNDSFLALHLQQFHPWFLGLLPVVALLLGFIKGEKSHHG
jgi:hypothetical protein